VLALPEDTPKLPKRVAGTVDTMAGNGLLGAGG